MTSPPEPLLTSPHITVPEFLAAPTWLDSQDLIPGGTDTQQKDELYNVLLRASGWANRIAEQPLQAHTVIWQDRVPVDRWGNIYIVPPHNPVRQVNAVAFGSDFQSMSLISNLQAQLWIDGDGKSFMVSQVPNGGAYLGSLQFGRTSPGMSSVYVQYSYVAGYCATTLTAGAASGTNSLTVADPTGLQPPVTGGLVGTIPGSVARIWDPGNEEAVQVNTGWTTGTNPVALASNLLNSHAIGAGVSEMPPEIHQAIYQLVVAYLCRDDVSDEEPFGGSPFGPSMRESHSGGKAGGLVDNAREILLRYRPVVH